jgi:spore germination protein YaaH
MKKLLLFLFFVILLAGGWFFLRAQPFISPINTQSISPRVNPTKAIQNTEQKTSLFVPYWGLNAAIPVAEYDTLIYFGISPGKAGINTEESGYKNLRTFTEKAEGKMAYLTLRMLDSKNNFAILENTSLQDRLIAETLTVAKEHDFDGILLDLEVSALPFESVIKQIAAFNKRFYQAVKKDDLHYAVALYGDTFFRIRPFDVKSMAANSDEVMIMAYDFHKSRGNPGPNFPLSGKDRYGYDYASLIEHFSVAVPREKLTVVFGLFGYDWTVNKDKNMTAHGEPLSFNQIEARFITDCSFTACKKTRDPLSAESNISYRDDEGLHHLVWYEDMDSVAKKQEFLKRKGINSYSFWAHSYF